MKSSEATSRQSTFPCPNGLRPAGTGAASVVVVVGLEVVVVGCAVVVVGLEVVVVGCAVVVVVDS